MPFNVHLADNEDAIIQAGKSGRYSRPTKAKSDFIQGLSVGLIFVACIIATYWLASEMISKSPKLQAMLPF